MSQLYRTQDGDMVDEICWLYYGYTQSIAERVLAANPGLAEQPPILPAGLLIELPEVTPRESQPRPLADPWEA